MNSSGEISPTTYPYSYAKPDTQKGILAFSLAELRARLAPLRFTKAAKVITAELQLTEQDKILELGSGLGLLGEAIERKIGSNIQYFGLDILMDSAQNSNNRGLPSVQANLVSLPFANDTFDHIVSTDVFEHLAEENVDLAVSDLHRVLKPGGKAFMVIADPSEARFKKVSDHVDRTHTGSDVSYWENKFTENGFKLKIQESAKYRKKDWRKIFNLPFLVKLKDKPGFACAFNPVERPGVYIIEKPN